ncbi:Sugar phosphate isomerase/epimerase [Caldanaerobius fijiensis DSM 17918]|uniref:Sugar phosphate isomerase/epimerase n=1 Tax=Caldanaerobius fijiensis DSM 17918 TaxID=1121256 RepID=A0A1M4YK59_9THEO|nr:sugar phosphate isomerase/epimerase family protein [Caldanaerobius fijiensis]SHF06121.1 Sugar phosphate isomerase/epimerase [Caldanaerobius fijiensis DSM 17918]
MKLCISSWSLRSEFGTDGIDMIEFIRLAKEEFGADAIELLPMHISPPTTPKPKGSFGGGEWEKMSEEERQAMFKRMMEHVRKIYKTRPTNLEEVKAALDKYGVKVMNMPLDYGDISNPDDETRKEDIEILKMWIDIAAFLGSKSVRVNTGFRSSEKDLNTIVSSYKELAEYGATKGVAVAMENHGGVSADPKNIVKIFEMVNHPNFRICPDFGNFDDDIRYEALDMIFDLNPILVHAKTYDFDEQGNQTRFDFGRCIEIAKKHGYDGYYSVEFEGQGDQFEGVRKTIALLRKYL